MMQVGKNMKNHVLFTGSRSNLSLQQATVFHAEARSRVLFFDSAVSAKILSQKGSAQLLTLPRRPTPRRSFISDQDAWLQRTSLSSRNSLNSPANLERHGSNDEIRFASDNSIPIGQIWGSGNSWVPDKYTAKALEISVFGSQVRKILFPRTFMLSSLYIRALPSSPVYYTALLPLS